MIKRHLQCRSVLFKIGISSKLEVKLKMTVSELLTKYKNEIIDIKNTINELKEKQLKKNSTRIRDEIMALNYKKLTLERVIQDLEVISL